MNTDVIVWWRRTIEVAMLLGALVVIGIFWRDAPPAVVPVLLGLIGAALGTGQSPVSTVSTTFKTVRPPPMPPPPAIWSETYVKDVPPPPDTKP